MFYVLMHLLLNIKYVLIHLPLLCHIYQAKNDYIKSLPFFEYKIFCYFFLKRIFIFHLLLGTFGMFFC